MAKWPYNTAQWQALRSTKLSEQPLCQACLRRDVVEPAHAVDHVVAIAAGGEPFPPLGELMSLCEQCHNSKTNAVDHPNASGFRRALKGFDVDGNPIDGEGWETPPAPCAAAAIRTPGADQGRETLATGPAPNNNEDLVLQTVRNKESDLWV